MCRQSEKAYVGADPTQLHCMPACGRVDLSLVGGSLGEQNVHAFCTLGSTRWHRSLSALLAKWYRSNTEPARHLARRGKAFT